jgi:hypothetical protein
MRLLQISDGDCDVHYFRSGILATFCPSYMPVVTGLSLKPGTWTELAIAIQRRSGGLHLALKTGEAPNAQSVESDVALPGRGTAYDTAAGVGIGCLARDVEGTVEFDDVLVEAR